MDTPAFYKPLKPSYYRRDKNHDYSSRCIYMLTLLKSDDMPWMSQISGGIGDYTGQLRVRVRHSSLGIIANNELANLRQRFPWIEIWRSVIMPDHIHFVIYIKEAGHCHLGRIEETLCGNISRAWHNFQGKSVDEQIQPVFKPFYHDRILRRKGQLAKMKSYVANNPLRYYRRKMTPAPFKQKALVEIAGKQYTIFGNPELLEKPDIFAVKLSRKFSYAESKAKSAWLIEESTRGAVLAGPYIRIQEKKIMAEAIKAGGSIIKMVDNAIGERYSLKAPFDELFMEGRALLIGPGEERTGKIEDTEVFFHALNDLAALLEEGTPVHILKRY